ncbi:hypothetical protein PanWU01x14_224410 [Parasponia andersonii]|uniref:Uncharacterized protein n=1 Tax=Parasponia andersonii TaxID=3476 RepID=A0A2P5BN74_PARAD|nr:hypothetical protein PanWU01x14_224410 [Parasponia andersonii]
MENGKNHGEKRRESASSEMGSREVYAVMSVSFARSSNESARGTKLIPTNHNVSVPAIFMIS